MMNFILSEIHDRCLKEKFEDNVTCYKRENNFYVTKFSKKPKKGTRKTKSEEIFKTNENFSS